MLYRRVKDALLEHRNSELTYAVFTFRQGQDRLFRDAEHAYRELGACLARMVRMLRAAWPGEPVEYVATVEAHRSGWPHLNVVFRSAALAEYVRAFADDRRPDAWLADLQWRAGFGEMGTWDGCRGAADAAGYFAKLAGMFTDAAGRISSEVVKITQLPIGAPARMRRLRSSRGFLPKRQKKGCFAAIMVCAKGERACSWHEDHLRRRGLEVVDDFGLKEHAPTVGAAPLYWDDDAWWDDRTGVFTSILANGVIRRDLERAIGSPPEPEWWDR